uniref:Ethylene-and jasmonate-responsive plant defensin n=1 Tax=Flammulina velutipes TaxID=38945 RepID=A0A1B2U6Y1_FLAVE|nr:ethylene- and jasmonate-responsive plant defensin [Flammulina velutipes]
MTMYKHRQPSTTSFSDDDDDNGIVDNDKPLVFSPAQWSRKRLHASKPPSRSPMSNLPPEILIHIFRHLHTLRDLHSTLRVCRTWCECSVELLWHKPTLDKFQTLQKIAKLLASPSQTFTYASFIRRLNCLNLHEHLTDEIFSTFVQCDRLERITLVNCDKLTAPLLNRVIPSFANLVAMDASGVKAITNEAVIGLARNASRLQGINLTGCKDVSNAGVMAVARNCPLLRRIKLSNLESLTDEPIQVLARSCPFLMEVDLNHCKLITDIAIRDIWTYCTHMREIRLSHCELLTDAAFPVPFRKDQTGSEAPNPFPSNVPSEDLPPLVLNRTMEHLRMLDLTACAHVTDEALEGIISHAPKIRNLGLSKCSLLSDKSVEAICKLGRHLHYLHLGHADKITDRSVRTLARSCTRLRYVDFANCTQLTDLAVFELANLQKLRRVGLVRVNNITDEAIYAMAERHATLERIHLSYCDQVSVMAVHFLLQKLHKLTHLSLTGVPAFRQAELQQFCRPAPSDFNSNQQSAFCVFSGKGVSQLRAFLTELFDRITEMNGTDDTEYEDDDYEDGEGYDDDDIPDGEEGDEPFEEADYATQRALLHAMPQLTPYRGHQNPDYGYSTRHSAAPPAAHRQHQPLEVSTTLTNLNGATDRLNAQLMASSNAAGPSRRPNRTMADILPIVEHSASSPTRADIPAGMSSRSGTLIAPRRVSDGVHDGGMTSYGDIGRGRAAPEGHLQLRRGHEHHPHPRPGSSGAMEAETGGSDLWTNERRPPLSVHTDSMSSFEVMSGSSEGVAWPYQEPVSPTTSTVVGHKETVATPPQDTPPDGRGRNVKRSLRNTLNVAEHYASTLLFGRSPTRQEGAGSSAGPSRGHY